MAHYIAKACGNMQPHGQHVHVVDRKGYACFGRSADCACGWVNQWTDSGDRGLAAADHERECQS